MVLWPVSKRGGVDSDSDSDNDSDSNSDSDSDSHSHSDSDSHSDSTNKVGAARSGQEQPGAARAARSSHEQRGVNTSSPRELGGRGGGVGWMGDASSLAFNIEMSVQQNAQSIER